VSRHRKAKFNARRLGPADPGSEVRQEEQPSEWHPEAAQPQTPRKGCIPERRRRTSEKCVRSVWRAEKRPQITERAAGTGTAEDAAVGGEQVVHFEARAASDAQRRTGEGKRRSEQEDFD